MDRWYGKVAVVTGASSGIGAAVAEALVEKGLVVVGLARRLDRLEQLSKKLSGKLHYIKTDMTKEEDIVNAIKTITATYGPIHILVNSAGIIVPKSLLDGDADKWKQVFDTNVVGLCIATKEVINSMMANKVDGHVVHINSILGHKPLMGVNVYSASKFAIRNVAEIMRQELNAAKSKIKISSVSPGCVDNEFLNNVGISREYMDAVPKLKSEDIAEAVLYALGTPPQVQIREIIINAVGEPI